MHISELEKRIKLHVWLNRKMTKLASASSPSLVGCWAIFAAALILCAVHVELVQGGKPDLPISISFLCLLVFYYQSTNDRCNLHAGGRPMPPPPAPVGRPNPRESCPLPSCTPDPPSPSSASLTDPPPAPPAAAADVPPAES